MGIAKVDEQESSGDLEELLKGGDVTEPKRSVFRSFAGGGLLSGEQYPFPAGDGDDAQVIERAPDIFLKPEGLAEAPAPSRDFYEFDGGGGAEFPREILDEDFVRRMIARRAEDRKLGKSTTLDLSESYEEESTEA